MTTVKVKGQQVRVGDDLWFLGRPYRVTRIEDYTHPGIVPAGETWRIAYSDGPVTGGKHAFGITLEYQYGYAAGYEISVRPEPQVTAP